MATVSGACAVNKVSGLLQIREDTVPSKLIWKAIDQDKTIEVPLNNLSRLQASPDTSPKMLLRLFYMGPDCPDVQDIKLSFNNRQTMAAVKEALQTIVARQKTVIKDGGGTAGGAGVPSTANPAAGSDSATPLPARDPLDFSLPELLTASELLKNRVLQQKLLQEDRVLRSIFTETVINFKLHPSIFWSSRVGQLRTYALASTQHRGPYNVLSTIKPVATSENQVNVNVTRDTIQEMFELYPVIRRAHDDLVPKKLSEGEFWSRFFNSKLFRRLRGDRINNSNTRGDVVIDRYLDDKSDPPHAPAVKRVRQTIDLLGNEVDNPQKPGLAPDYTMKFSAEESKDSPSARAEAGGTDRRETEMILLMRNMNRLSRKMISYNTDNSVDTETATLTELTAQEVDLPDLHDAADVGYVELHMDWDGAWKAQNDQEDSSEILTPAASTAFLRASMLPSDCPVDLCDTYNRNNEEISRASQNIAALVRHNFRVYKLLHSAKDVADGAPLFGDDQLQELVTFNVTLVEFLLHFWSLLLSQGSPAHLKKLFATLRQCQTALGDIREKLLRVISECAAVDGKEKVREKLAKDLDNCLMPLTAPLLRALKEYVAAARAGQEVNENGKRALSA